jgi:quinol monooxygenase YgiN
MATIFIRHKVKDFNDWKKAYDDFKSIRMSKGVLAASVHRDVNDGSNVIVTHKFKDENSARSFLDSEQLKSAMAEAGITGEPEIWIGEDIE